MLCGPCALLRWRRVVDAEVTGTSAAGMRRLFKKAPVVTSESRHVCREPGPAAARRWPCRCSHRSTSGDTSHSRSNR